MSAQSSNATADVSLSFVIPALNESQHIGAVIQSIRRFCPAELISDIVMVDNGSSDGTPEIARRCQARVIEAPGVTVAELRNQGARAAHGKILAFLDGDVLLTEQWLANIASTLQLLRTRPMTVTGSRCGLSRCPGWIERHWFAPLIAGAPRYINSGHLITTQRLFNAIGGFDSRLRTGEDLDFSVRARQAGATIANDLNLAVIHEGYPKTLGHFFRREMWHGAGCLQRVSDVLRSRVSVLTVVFVLLHVLSVGLFVTLGPVAALACLTSALAMCLMSSVAKYRHSPRSIATNTYIYYWYYAGRGLGLLRTLLHLPVPRPSQS